MFTTEATPQPLQLKSCTQNTDTIVTHNSILKNRYHAPGTTSVNTLEQTPVNNNLWSTCATILRTPIMQHSGRLYTRTVYALIRRPSSPRAYARLCHPLAFGINDPSAPWDIASISSLQALQPLGARPRCHVDTVTIDYCLSLTHVLHVAEAGVRLEVVVLDLKDRDRSNVRSNICTAFAHEQVKSSTILTY